MIICHLLRLFGILVGLLAFGCVSATANQRLPLNGTAFRNLPTTFVDPQVLTIRGHSPERLKLQMQLLFTSRKTIDSFGHAIPDCGHTVPIGKKIVVLPTASANAAYPVRKGNQFEFKLNFGAEPDAPANDCDQVLTAATLYVQDSRTWLGSLPVFHLTMDEDAKALVGDLNLECDGGASFETENPKRKRSIISCGMENLKFKIPTKPIVLNIKMSGDWPAPDPQIKDLSTLHAEFIKNCRMTLSRCGGGPIPLGLEREILAIASRTCEASPKDPACDSILAELSLLAGQREKAIGHMQAACKGGQASFCIKLAKHWEQVGDWSKAASSYKKACTEGETTGCASLAFHSWRTKDSRGHSQFMHAHCGDTPTTACVEYAHRLMMNAGEWYDAAELLRTLCLSKHKLGCANANNAFALMGHIEALDEMVRTMCTRKAEYSSILSSLSRDCT